MIFDFALSTPRPPLMTRKSEGVADNAVYGVSIQRRVPLALTEDGNTRAIVGKDLNVDLCPFSVVFGFRPHFMRVCNKMKGVVATSAFLSLRYLVRRPSAIVKRQ
jgi:hypothetical protein